MTVLGLTEEEAALLDAAKTYRDAYREKVRLQNLQATLIGKEGYWGVYRQRQDAANKAGLAKSRLTRLLRKPAT